MKRFIFGAFAAAALVLALPCEAAPPKAKAAKKAKTAPKAKKAVSPLSKIVINVTTDKSALSYKPGEKMVFTFKVDFNGATPGDWYLKAVRKGDDNKTFSKQVPANQTLTVETSIDKPGFVSVDAFLTNKKGQRVRYDGTKNIIVYGGAGVQAETLRDCGEPKDFDAFWAGQKKRLAQVPFKGKVERKLVKETKQGFIYAVTIPAPGPRPVTGYLTIPRNAKAKSLPAMVQFNGYSDKKQTAPARPFAGRINFRINAHGFKLGESDAYYKEFAKSIRSGKYGYAFDPEQNKNRETCYFNGMVLRVLRALEYVKSLKEWNGKDLIASGGSQGGLQTMWAAALDQDVTEARPSITWCCDLAGTEKAKRLSGTWRIQYVPALDYYDSVFMAKRIKKAKVIVGRAGLGDYVCPPSGLAICYNNLATPDKTMIWVQGSSHGYTPKKSEKIVWTTVKTDK